LKVDANYNSPQVTPVTNEDRAGNQVGWFYQLGLLIKRNGLNILRLPQTSYVKILVTIITSIFTIVLFQGVDDSKAGVQNRNGVLFFMTMTISFNAI
jgi:hypothetical protein